MSREKMPIWAAVAALVFLTSACTPRGLLRADEVLVYNRAYDFVFLRTMEAVDNVPNWSLSDTDKEKGLLSVRSMNFSSGFDAEKRIATFVVKRISRRKTSVELEPQSQTVIGGKELLRAIDQLLGQYRVK